MFVCAVDGGVSTGKSSILKGLSERLAWPYLNGGLIYRSVTLLCERDDLDPQTKEDVLSSVFSERVVGNLRSGELRMSVDGEDVTARLMSPWVNANVSAVSSIGQVRQWATLVQRSLVDSMRDRSEGVLVDGRDVTTVVFPGADLRVLLVVRRDVADVRRSSGDVPDRDARDSRVSKFLEASDGQFLVDTSSISIQVAIDTVYDHLVRCLNGAP